MKYVYTMTLILSKIQNIQMYQGIGLPRDINNMLFMSLVCHIHTYIAVKQWSMYLIVFHFQSIWVFGWYCHCHDKRLYQRDIDMILDEISFWNFINFFVWNSLFAHFEWLTKILSQVTSELQSLRKEGLLCKRSPSLLFV